MSGTDRQFGESPPSVQVENLDPLIGTELGGFRVEKLLAAGGMGLVYEALHPAIGRRAAVKVLKPEVAADAEWTKRFLSEARALGAIKHRNLIEVLNFGKTSDGREFLMMEFLDGEPLDAYIRRLGQLAPAVALGIADQILNGLAEAHKKGVVHRDLKPANVFLLREHNGELLVKVLDFGLARQEPIALMDGSINLAKRSDGASLLAGTPEYIAPEQAQGKKVEGSADLYSLGVMLFEMVTGQLPFEAESVTALLQKHLSERPPRLSAVMSNVPDGLEEFVESLLLKEPERRPASADIARATVQRLLKRLAQDSTAVRTVHQGAQTEPLSTKHLPTARIDRSQVPGVTERALDAAFPERKKRTGLIVALALLVLLLLGGIGLTIGSPPVLPEPSRGVPSEPVTSAPTQRPPAPEPLKAEPVAEAEPDPELTPVAPIPPKPEPAKPEVPVAVVAKPKVLTTVNSDGCQPTDDWKRQFAANLSDLSDSAAKDSRKYEIFDQHQPTVARLANNATTPNECAAAERAFADLRAKVAR